MPNPNKKIGPKARTTKSRMGKRALMQVDPMTGMPVAQPGSTPMFPVSEGANAGSTDKFNPLTNQYAMADPLANAAYASQPMPALAQTMSLEEKQRTLLPKEGSIGTPAPTKGVKTEVIKPKMSMEMKSKPLPPERQVKTGVLDPTMQMKKVITPLPPTQDTLNYRQMAVGRRALNQEKDAAQIITQNIGPEIMRGAANLIPGVPIAKAASELGNSASNVLNKIRQGAKKHFEEKDPALKQKPIPKDATGLQELAKSGPKGEAAVENMGYNPNALARMRGNGMYKKNCGYKK